MRDTNTRLTEAGKIAYDYGYKSSMTGQPRATEQEMETLYQRIVSTRREEGDRSAVFLYYIYGWFQAEHDKKMGPPFRAISMYVGGERKT